MITVTNHSTADQAFNVKGGGIEIVKQGETRKLDIADIDSAQNKGRAHAGVVTFEGAGAKALAKKD